MEQILSIERLFFSYGTKEVLRNLSLRLGSGESVALVGINGSGKSTLLKIIAGQNPIVEGRIRLFGEDVKNWSTSRRINSGLAFAMQGFRIFPSLTFLENLEISMPSLSKKQLRKTLDENTKDLPAISGLLPKRAGLLSGGQRKILSILMQLIKKPRILLLDEPLVGLDVPTAETVLELLDSIRSRYGTSLIIVEHNLDALLPRTDRAIILKNGEAIEIVSQPFTLKIEKQIEELLLDTTFYAAREFI